MLRLTLAQMRRSVGRLVAAGIAILIGTAFVTATLLAGNAMTRTAYDAFTTTLADADLVVQQQGLTEAQLAAIAETHGVATVEPMTSVYLELSGPRGRLYTPVKAAAADPRLEPEVLAEGRMPTTDDEVAIPEGLADVLGTGLGETATLTVERWVDDPTSDEGGTWESERHALEVTGVLDTTATAFLGTGGTSVVTADNLAAWMTYIAPGSEADFVQGAIIAVADGASVATTQTSVREVLGGADRVLTKDEAAQRLAAQFTGSEQSLVAVVLGFAAVALLVAGLVIANTFQVLVAQRTRTLALLRCVGAGRGQLRRSVVLEALILGGAASAAGVLLGVGLVQTALTVLGRTMPQVPVPSTVSVTAVALVVPLVVGVVVTVLSAMSPARAATRVSPLAALRPSDSPSITDRGGRLRAWAALLLMVGGAAVLVLGMVVATNHDMLTGLGLGVLGGAASFVGVVVAAVFWVPWVLRGLGALVSRGGPSVRLATANSVRNPRRTSATSAALLIGVTLVAMMATGAATARDTLMASLDEEYPVDIAVTTQSGAPLPTELPGPVAAEISTLDGITASAPISQIEAQVEGNSGGQVLEWVTTVGIDTDEVSEVVRSGGYVGGLDDTTVLVPARASTWTQIEAGDQLTLSVQPDGGSSTDPAGETREVTLTAVVTDLPGNTLVVTRTNLEQIAPGVPVSGLWLQVEELGAAAEVVGAVNVAAAASEAGLSTTGAAVERAFFDQVITTLLAVVVGLLGVAVVIALVGVANTLSLSVIERRRESATLRAIGLSRRQLRGTLAVEGMLIALVGALVGSVLGTVYGWAGAQTLLGELASTVTLEVPWASLGVVLVVALVAGLLASVLPGRSAARTPPVQALGVE